MNEKIARMNRPDALKKDEAMMWSPGTGVQIWEVFCAAISGDVETLRRMLDEQPALANCHYVYRTPLYFAVRENQFEAAGLLLKRGADPLGLAVNDSFLQIAQDRGYGEMEELLRSHIEGELGASPRGEAVTAAIRDYDGDKVCVLLDAEPELLHAGDAHGSQPIHWATMTRQIELIDELLARGADINAKRPDKARPLHLSNGDYIYRGWRDVPEHVTTTAQEVQHHLIERGAYVDIWMAAHIGDLERVKTLLEKDPSLANRTSDYGSYYAGSGSALRNAAAGGFLEVVKLLLDYGADPNLPEEHIAPRGHALYSAVTHGHYEIAKLLLEHGAYPNPPVESSADALTIAMSKSDDKMVELLCSYGAARSVSLLASSGDLQTAAAVFAVSPEVANDPEAMAVAAANGHEALVRLMLRYQSDLATRIVFDKYWWVGAKTTELNELLFEHGMNPSQRDWLGMTPLHYFAMKGEIEKAAQYLDHGAELEPRDDDICSRPLGWAAKFGKADMVKFLLERGAKVQTGDDPAWATPLTWAKRRGHDDVARILEEE